MEKEGKSEIGMEPCLVCANPAVWFDTEGNPVKKEVISDKYSYYQLFSNLCCCLGMEGNCTLTQLDFNINPFPFCDQCVTLMVDVAELYRKLKDMRKILKEKIVTAEEDYVRGKLYDQRHPGFVAFRQYFIPERFAANLLEMDGMAGGGQATGSGPHSRVNTPVTSERKDDAVETVIKTEYTDAQLPQEGSDFDVEMNEPDETSPVPSPSPSNPYISRLRSRAKTKPAKIARGITKKIVKVKSSNQLKPGSKDQRKRTIVKTEKYVKKDKCHLKKVTLDCKISTSSGRVGSCMVKESETCVNPFTTRKCRKTGSLKRDTRKKKEKQSRFKSRLYKCLLCAEKDSFQTKLLLSEHLLQIHNLTAISAMKKASYRKKKESGSNMEMDLNGNCEICGMPFSDIRSRRYRDHLLTHMSEAEKTESRRFAKFVCKLCSDKPSFQNKLLLTEHVKTVHNLPSVPSMLSVYYRKISKGTNKNVRICPTCGKAIRNGKPGMDAHLKTHLPKEERDKYLCSLCGSKHTSHITLRQHMLHHHPGGVVQKNICKFPSCGENFDSEEALSCHVASEHGSAGEKAFMCQFCGKIFGSEWGYKNHEKVHIEGKQHQCPVCCKMFSGKDTKEVHMAKQHSQGEQYGEFGCTFEKCGLVFPCEKYRKQHMREKHGIKIGKRKSNPIKRLKNHLLATNCKSTHDAIGISCENI